MTGRMGFLVRLSCSARNRNQPIFTVWLHGQVIFSTTLGVIEGFYGSGGVPSLRGFTGVY